MSHIESIEGPESMGGPHPASLTEDELLAACDIQFTRRSGPGGQHRNKVETAVILSHRPSGISAEAHEERSQAENRRVALARLRLKLAVEVRCSPSESVSELWQSRRHGTRIVVSSEHRDLAALIAEALDVLSLHEFVTANAAAALGVTTSQLVGLLKKHPPALQLLNDQRARAGKPPLN